LYIAVATPLLKEYEYEQIGKAIGHMGATFCNKLNNLTTNLLIADKATGPKYEFMAKKGKPIVKMRWLQDCIQQVSGAGTLHLLRGFVSVSDMTEDHFDN